MPRISSWFVKSSLVYLAAGFTLGALLLINKALEFYPLLWRWLPVHEEALLIGWLVQLAAGVAYWILPRLSGPSPRGSSTLAWLAFWLLNAGILLVVLEAVSPLYGLLLPGRLIELAGVAIFVVASWKRVKAFGR